MTSLAADESSAVTVPAVSGRYRTAVTAVLAGVAYLFAAELGMTLTMRPQPISTLWPPNAILFGLLLLTPQRRWWVILLGAFPAHLLVELWSGIPLPMILCWFLSNASEALIGASVVMVLGGGPARFDTFRGVGIFLLAAPTSVFISCFLDAGFVQLNGWGSTGYWHNWSVRFLSNLLAQLTFVPLIVTWGEAGRRGLRRLWGSRAIEAAVLAVMLTLVCLLVFTRAGPSTNTSPALLYAPLPFLLWAAVRFGPAATSASLLLVALLAVTGAVAGKGPFAGDTPAANVLAMQSFLIVVAIPLMTLAAITRERAAAEERARTSEKRLQLALDAARMGTWEWEVGTGRGVWSDTSAAIFGVPSAGDGGLARFLHLVVPEDRVAVSTALDSAAAGGTPYDVQFRIRHPDGSVRWIHAKAAALADETGRLTRLVGVNADITEREMAYATVNEWKNRYEAAIQSSNQLLYDWDPDTNDVRYGGDLERILGYTEQEMGGGLAGWLEKVYPDDRLAFEAEVARVIETHDSFRLVYRFRRKDGRVIWVEDRGHFFRDAQGVVSRMVGFIEDVTERTRSDQALRSSEERFSLVFRSSPQAIQITRQRDARILEVNDTWEAVFGYGREEAIGRTAADLGMFISPADRERLLGLLDDGRPVRDYELELRTRSGEVRQVTIDAERVDVGGEPCYLTFVRDVTERRQAEARGPGAAAAGRAPEPCRHAGGAVGSAGPRAQPAAHRHPGQCPRGPAADGSGASRPRRGSGDPGRDRGRRSAGGRGHRPPPRVPPQGRDAARPGGPERGGVRGADPHPQRPDPAAGHGGHDRPVAGSPGGLRRPGADAAGVAQPAAQCLRCDLHPTGSTGRSRSRRQRAGMARWSCRWPIGERGYRRRRCSTSSSRSSPRSPMGSASACRSAARSSRPTRAACGPTTMGTGGPPST